MFRKLLDQGQAGDNIGALIRGVNRDGVERGQILCKPGSVKPHKKFKAEAYILTKEEGGRHTPFFTNYRPQFYFRTTDVTGIVTLPEGTEMVMPGDNVTVDVELIVPIAMEEKLRFAIREGGRTVGAGIVARSSSNRWKRRARAASSIICWSKHASKSYASRIDGSAKNRASVGVRSLCRTLITIVAGRSPELDRERFALSAL